MSEILGDATARSRMLPRKVVPMLNNNNKCVFALKPAEQTRLSLKRRAGNARFMWGRKGRGRGIEVGSEKGK